MLRSPMTTKRRNRNLGVTWSRFSLPAVDSPPERAAVAPDSLSDFLRRDVWIAVCFPYGKKTSAGILLYRRPGDALEVFLIHPGGPFVGEEGPRRMVHSEEASRTTERICAMRRSASSPRKRDLRSMASSVRFVRCRSRAGDDHAWAVEGDCDPAQLRSEMFSMEWPPRSGRQREFRIDFVVTRLPELLDEVLRDRTGGGELA